MKFHQLRCFYSYTYFHYSDSGEASAFVVAANTGFGFVRHRYFPCSHFDTAFVAVVHSHLIATEAEVDTNCNFAVFVVEGIHKFDLVEVAYQHQNTYFDFAPVPVVAFEDIRDFESAVYIAAVAVVESEVVAVAVAVTGLVIAQVHSCNYTQAAVVSV